MRSTLVRGAAAALSVVLLAGCTGGDDPEPTTTASQDGTPGAPEDGGGTDAPDEGSTTEAAGAPTMPASVEDELAALDTDAAEVLGSAQGEIQHADTPVTAEVLSVTRHEDGLDLSFRLTPEDAVNSFKFSQELSADRHTSEISAVRLVSGEEFVAPLLYQADPEEWDIADMRCLCSKLPQKIGTEGFVLHASFPDFDEAVETVSVSIPGFEEIEDIPVR